MIQVEELNYERCINYNNFAFSECYLLGMRSPLVNAGNTKNRKNAHILDTYALGHVRSFLYGRPCIRKLQIV